MIAIRSTQDAWDRTEEFHVDVVGSTRSSHFVKLGPSALIRESGLGKSSAKIDAVPRWRSGYRRTITSPASPTSAIDLKRHFLIGLHDHEAIALKKQLQRFAGAAAKKRPE